MTSTETVAVLFTDIVGSTELAMSVPSDIADEVRRTHFSVLRRAIAASDGTEVKSLGDGLMAVCPNPSSALACAVSMQQGVEGSNRRSPHTVGLRVGLSIGEATREEDDYFGEPVIEAARLCAKAQGGQILVSDMLRAMAGRRSPHSFRSLGELELKGLPDPITTHEVGWEPLAEHESVAPTGEFPLPHGLTYRSPFGIIGRDAELAFLEDARKRTDEQVGPEVVLIAGEAGQGKTTVAAEVARRAHQTGSIVLLGRCDEDLRIPYGPFCEALGHYLTHAPDELLASQLAEHWAPLARMVPAARQRLGDAPLPDPLDADTERYLFYGAASDLLGSAGAIRPVVLVLDDLQWADDGSLQLLRHLVKHIAEARVLIVATYRAVEVGGTHPLTETLGSLRREQGVSRLELKGLGDLEVTMLLEAAAGHDLDERGVALAHLVQRETDGNPFFVTELLRHLAESGTIVQDGTGRWVPGEGFSDLTLPESVREVVAARAARVGGSAITALSMAAVIGRDFDLDLLVQATGMDEDGLLDLLDDAVTASLVREIPDAPGRYSFSHALVQRTLYKDLGGTRRARSHRRVAEALEDLLGERTGQRAEELAYHFLNATTPAHLDKALAYAREAGHQALLALAPGDAVRHYSQAIELLEDSRDPDPLLSIDLLLSLGISQRQAGIAAFRETLLAAARQAGELGDGPRLAQAALANNRGYVSTLGEVDSEREQALELALQTLSEAESTERALLMATLCAELSYGPLDRRLALARQAKAIARQLGDKATLGKVLYLCDDSLRVPSLLGERLADSIEALTLGEDLGDPVISFWAASAVQPNAHQAGEFELAERAIETMNRLSVRLNQPSLVWHARFHEAAQAMLHGDCHNAERLATEALDLGMASGQPDALLYYGTQMGVVRLQQGRASEFVSLIAEVAEANPTIPSYTAALACAQLEAGNESEALRLLEAAAQQAFSLPPQAPWMDGILAYCAVAIELAVPDAAEQLLALVDPIRDQIPSFGMIAREPVATFAGGLASVLGRYDQAEEYFEIAADLADRGGMKFAEAQTDLLRGRMLVARGEDARGRQLLERARSRAATGGYAMVERRAAAAL
jgi:class 3 adenylate cyclase